MGSAAADYDNDGNVDLFVAGVFRNTLYRNRGDGRFEDVTEKAGIKSDKWSVAAGWFDYNNDGLLDLFVVNYASWSPSYNRFCGDPSRNLRVYCHPKYFEGLASTLYRNRGDGTFEDVSAKAGIAKHAGRGMSVSFADYDQDGWPDAFVTNDNMPNFLFHNRGDGTFEEGALGAEGCGQLETSSLLVTTARAFREGAGAGVGAAKGRRGAAFADSDGDGRVEAVVSALGEGAALWANVSPAAGHWIALRLTGTKS